jgi:hypothetical protein
MHSILQGRGGPMEYLNPRAVVSYLLMGVLTFGMLPVTAAGATPVIRHTPSACIPANELPQFTVEIEGEVESSWLNFRCTPASGEEWFKVPMEKVAEGTYVGTAPTPDPSKCQAFEYSVDATSTDMERAVTPTYRLPIRGDLCGDGGAVATSASATPQAGNKENKSLFSNPIFWGLLATGAAAISVGILVSGNDESPSAP